ncbi:MarR family winged helix-turn-helix transcriptional regulator [Sulfitobacter guttiformis]|uniref:MarR family transcriptional regulator n=1 Tax=Sulfitobacter guttiformis TaxID=74349 RepID=J7G045_9RHOB|nr:MarR family transcriptional regulator [Sulfitobacter guttiformis]AFP55377.1 transcriptional regulator, MarR family [Sulfitobacter guttiformis]KIN75531.1 Transcriptional regulator, MarR family [Sulfitobacter guttiformis KCTC 32187]RKE91042.1 MarR family transcriptional regulator [Sulfitobacter guttiformis]
MIRAEPLDKPLTPSKERLRLWLRFLKTTRTIEATLRENLRREFATTLPRFDVMAALSRYDEGLKMSQLSGVLRVSNGNVTGIVDRLADDGLLVRVPVPGDRRASLVRLTKRGTQEFARQAAAHEAWINEMLGEFPAEEAHHIAARLEQLGTSLDEEIK